MENNNKLIPIAQNNLIQKVNRSISITNKLIAENNRQLVKEIFENNLLFFIQLISKFHPVNNDLLNKYKDYWTWEEVQNNVNIHWTNELIHKYQSNIDYFYMYYVKIVNHTTETKRLHYTDIYFRAEHREILNNGSISWTNNFIETYYNIWDWSELSNNKKINWSTFLIENYIDKWDWDKLSNNYSLCWTEDLITKFSGNWNWNHLSSNHGIKWNQHLISKYEKSINFNNLSSNINVEWDDKLIERFYEYWDWKQLSSNQNFPWTKNLIEEKIKIIDEV